MKSKLIIMKKQWWTDHAALVIIMAGFGLFGTLLLISSHASTPAASVEAENGALSGGAQNQSDATASAGHAVMFGSGSPASGIENPTAGAVSVMDPKYGLTGNDSQDADATTAFETAMDDAIAKTSVRYNSGPGGAPQAVVYVPAGKYRLSGLNFENNVRLEVNAGAVLEPIVQPNPYNSSYPTNMITLGGNDHTVQLTNISLVGVASVPNTALKQLANPVADGWDLSGYFTADFRPSVTGGANDQSLATLINVKGFLLKNIYVIDDDTLPSCSNFDDGCPTTRGSAYPPPTTSRAALVYRPSNESGTIAAGGPFYQPTNGSLINMYTIHAPYGFGATQITAGSNLIFKNMYSSGGTTLRLETDATKGKPFGGTVKGVVGDNIMGVNCNRPVSMASHDQLNDDVHLTNVRSVSCNDGLVQESENATNSGNFTNSTIDNLSVIAGNKAQLSIQNSNGRWTVGQSDKAIYVHPASIDWSANITNLTCSGSFASDSDPVTINGVPRTRVNC